MGRTGYSDTENTNNIETVHLHFGIELIFDEAARKNGKEIWIDAYSVVELLKQHRVTVMLNGETGAYKRKHAFVDLDREPMPEG